MGCKPNQNPCFLQLQLGPWQCSQLQNFLRDVIWNFIIVSLAGFLVLLHMILLHVGFHLVFRWTCWTKMLHSSESPRKETIAVWISHAVFIPEAPPGHSDPPKFTSLENGRSGFLMLEQTALLKYKPFPSVQTKSCLFC